MAVEKTMTPMQTFKKVQSLEISIEVENPDSVSVETEDGGMTDFTGEQVKILSGGFDSNLAEQIEEQDLREMARVNIKFNSDRQSRSEWAKGYVEGLDLLGMKIEERQQPW